MIGRLPYLLLCGALLAMAPNALRAQPEPSLPDGDEVMDRLRSVLPTVPLHIQADLQVRDRKGRIVRAHPVEMTLDWGGAIPSARYIVRDGFGTEQERFTVSWPPEGTPQFEYAKGDPPESQPLETANQSVAGLDLTWNDLSLSFLWWHGAQTVGAEKVRSRFCYIVDLPAPVGQADQVGGMRLWIDANAYLLLQADVYDARNRLQRRLQVKNLRKLDGVWMVQNLDIFNYATRGRLTLRVREMDQLDNSPPTDLDETEGL